MLGVLSTLAYLVYKLVDLVGVNSGCKLSWIALYVQRIYQEELSARADTISTANKKSSDGFYKINFTAWPEIRSEQVRSVAGGMVML